MAAVWKKALLQSLERNSSAPCAKFFQLATVRPDGRPANRTVVYRGFEEDSEIILFTTDTRSRKMEDFQAQPWAEVCWYFSETREQFRLNGRLSIVDASAASPQDQQLRNESWKQMSGGLRAWFAGPPPSAPRGGGDDSSADSSPAATDPPTPSFAVVRLDVHEVDYVDLVGNNRELYILDGSSWKQQALNP